MWMNAYHPAFVINLNQIEYFLILSHVRPRTPFVAYPDADSHNLN